MDLEFNTSFNKPEVVVNDAEPPMPARSVEIGDTSKNIYANEAYQSEKEAMEKLMMQITAQTKQ